MAKTFREWSVEQRWLPPPSVEELFPAQHVSHFIREVVREQLDLSAVFAAYSEERGAPPFHPTMMTALLLYAYSQGVYPSRKIARACAERVDFMAVTAMQKPDFRTVSEFRRRHLGALEGLFKQVLSKRKAMSYERMLKGEVQPEMEVKRWFTEAEAADDRDGDERHDEGTRRVELDMHRAQPLEARGATAVAGGEMPSSNRRAAARFAEGDSGEARARM